MSVFLLHMDCGKRLVLQWTTGVSLIEDSWVGLWIWFMITWLWHALTFMATYHPSTLYKMKHIWTSLKQHKRSGPFRSHIWDFRPPKVEQWWQKDSVDVVTIRRVSMLITSQMPYSHRQRSYTSLWKPKYYRICINSFSPTFLCAQSPLCKTAVESIYDHLCHILQEWRFACSWRWWRWHWWSGDVSKKCSARLAQHELDMMM